MFNTGCDREEEMATSSSKKRPYMPRVNKHSEQKVCGVKPIKLERDENGNIVYPFNVTTSLQILNLGTIDSSRKAFHSATNFFPIGFKSIREAPSILEPGKRGKFTCEIFDDGNKPIYRVSSLEDPTKVMTGDSSSAVWKRMA